MNGWLVIGIVWLIMALIGLAIVHGGDTDE